jgi:Fe-S cluster biogenesis protein NfuA
MTQAHEVITEVLRLLEPMVASDGGALQVAEFSAEAGTLVVDYRKVVNAACATSVIDNDSLQAFIDEGLRARSVHLAEITVAESAANGG